MKIMLAMPLSNLSLKWQWGLGWGCLVSVKCKQGGETETEREAAVRKEVDQVQQHY